MRFTVPSLVQISSDAGQAAGSWLDGNFLEGEIRDCITGNIIGLAPKKEDNIEFVSAYKPETTNLETGEKRNAAFQSIFHKRIWGGHGKGSFMDGVLETQPRCNEMVRFPESEDTISGSSVFRLGALVSGHFKFNLKWPLIKDSSVLALRGPCRGKAVSRHFISPLGTLHICCSHCMVFVRSLVLSFFLSLHK